MQGWTPDFIPKLTADAVEMNVINRIIPIANADALRCSRDLAQKEGIFVGITAGATFAGALRICAEAPKVASDALHAAGHRRTLSEYTAVRGRSHRYERRGNCNFGRSTPTRPNCRVSRCGDVALLC